MKLLAVLFVVVLSTPAAAETIQGRWRLTAWRPDYVGTEQKRFFRFENGKMFFGPAPNSARAGSETLTRRLTLERAGPGE